MPKVDSNHTWVAVISLDSASNKDRSCYSQLFVKKCKYNEKKVINDNLSDFSSSDESNKEYIFL